MGPYYSIGEKIGYIGNKLFSPIDDIRKINLPVSQDIGFNRIRLKSKQFSAIVKIHDIIFSSTYDFMKKIGSTLFNLPALTRMISSPGALNNSIPSDVPPFKIDFFGSETYLTQSSQLYLELALCMPDFQSLYCWEKSFRNEETDYRHLPEFTHVEFEGKIDFERNLEIQKSFFFEIIETLLNHPVLLEVFLKKESLDYLNTLCQNRCSERITFHNAFSLLYKNTGNVKYKNVTMKNFGVFEEILLTKLVGDVPVFVTNYLVDEVAFYHAQIENTSFALNADFLIPGYGELIGSGQRIHTDMELRNKAIRFNLSSIDYKPYIESRIDSGNIHSGWGCGIERFIHCVLKLPAIWEASVFPRLSNTLKP